MLDIRGHVDGREGGEEEVVYRWVIPVF